MGAVVCTLFEGDYHYGVAGLINSLYANGFRGSVYVGYRRTLPFWAVNAETIPFFNHEAFRLNFSDGLTLVFVPLTTDYHLTNYKPNFMQDVLSWTADQADSVAYFDPDIIVKCKWAFIEEWMACGVALVHEIIANDMPPTHPIRRKWENVILQSDRSVKRELASYINGGFIGVHRKHTEYLTTLLIIMQTAFTKFKLTPDQFKHNYDRSYEFYGQDQDAINIAAMCCESPISEMGPEAMDFIHGGWVMSHAVGSPKPWKKKFIQSFLTGSPPSAADKAYWRNASGVIIPFGKNMLRYKRSIIKLTSFLGRFYRKY